MRTAIIILSFVACMGYVHAQSTVSIPDPRFFEALVNAGVDLDNDGAIQISEALQVESLAVDNSDIEDLTGIEAFKNLTYLNCSSNQLNSLDITSNSKLEYLDCSFNTLSSLDVSKNSKLIHLDCVVNPIKTIDVTKNILLEELQCFYNQLSTLDLTKNTALKVLRFDYNNITSIDLSKNILLNTLSCPDNKLVSLDVTTNTLLQFLDCHSNQINDINLSKNVFLTNLSCYINNLTSLDVRANTSLTSLVCTSNPGLSKICVWEVDSVSSKAEFKKDPTAVWSDTCTVSALAEESGIDAAHHIYPNPVLDRLYIGHMALNAQIYDAIGELILQTEGSEALNVSDLRSGIYMIKVSYKDEKTYTQKFLKL